MGDAARRLHPAGAVWGTAGDQNKILPSDLSIHDWYRFVLSYPPHLVGVYLDKFQVQPGQTVLDPFCGTGTTLVECKKRGINSIGIESSPMAHFASTVKTNWGLDWTHLLNHATQVKSTALQRLAASGVADLSEMPLFSANNVADDDLEKLPEQAAQLLVKDSISPLPLHKVLHLLKAMELHSHPSYTPYEKLALAKALVGSIGNLKFGPEVGVGRIKRDAAVVESWWTHLQRMADDLESVDSLFAGESRVIKCDARMPVHAIQEGLVDAVITSPPYPNEKDYTRTTRLESVLLGLIRTRDELRAVKQSLLRSNTRGVYVGDADDEWIGNNKNISDIAQSIEARRIELGKTSGFEKLYPRVTKLYFGGMARHFDSIKGKLKAGARLAYVVGDQASYLRVMIRTGQLLAEIAKAQGYEVMGIDLFRTRLATATGEQLREEVVLLRWPG